MRETTFSQEPQYRPGFQFNSEIYESEEKGRNYYTIESDYFKQLKKEYPDLDKTLIEMCDNAARDIAMSYLSDEKPNKYFQRGDIKLTLLESDSEDSWTKKEGYKSAPPAAFKLEFDDKVFFLKTNPYIYHSGGPMEMVSTEHLQKALSENPVRGVRIPNPYYASSNSKRSYFLSEFINTSKDVMRVATFLTKSEIIQNGKKLEKEELEKIQNDIRIRINSVLAIASQSSDKSNKEIDSDFLFDDAEKNAFYDIEKDEIVMFDINVKVKSFYPENFNKDAY